MTAPTWSLRRIHGVDDAVIDGLTDVLLDCVEGGASVSFMQPLTRDRAMAFWRGVVRGVAAGDRALLVAEDAEGVCGTVQLILDLPENQPHRADLAKMLVPGFALFPQGGLCSTTFFYRDLGNRPGR